MSRVRLPRPRLALVVSTVAPPGRGERSAGLLRKTEARVVGRNKRYGWATSSSVECATEESGMTGKRGHRRAGWGAACDVARGGDGRGAAGGRRVGGARCGPV
jgi:hypothetical protein